VTAEEGVGLVEVALDDVLAGLALEGGAVGGAAGFGGVVAVLLEPVVAEAEELVAELGAEFVDIENYGIAGAVTDEDAAIAVEDVAAGAGLEDAAEDLALLHFIVIGFLPELAAGEAGDEDEEEAREDAAQDGEPEVAPLVNLQVRVQGLVAGSCMTGNPANRSTLS
jgi:hypothetical protein